MTADELRSARLLFASELAAGTLSESDLNDSEVAAAVAGARVPSHPARALQRLAVRRGRLSYEADIAWPMMRARRALLGDAAGGDPRLLIRVDEFPYYGAFDDPDGWTSTHRVFHRDALARTPHLLSVLPAVARDPLRPSGREQRPLTEGERELLRELRGDGVCFALHGFDHRSRSRRSRSHSELAGLSPKALGTLLDRGLGALAEQAQLHPRVFVAPFNRFDWRQWATLSKRFDVVGGGPESVRRFGWHRSPLWRGDAVYLPAYAPLYGRANEILEVVERLVEARASLWVPIVLHVSWEAQDEWAGLVRLRERVGRYAVDWHDFLDVVTTTRGRGAGKGPLSA
ncbi:MAG TPA: DUF2334 domain-containing protein [Solirubrobacteraceae bacterium]|nr:DUF2334 domain-containing protein [Solirubrobacteraceae bacterium]